jgi:hypothetical protein
MAGLIPRRFRPTVVLCLGEEGKAVGAQLSLLLPALDTARRSGVALLAADVDAQGNTHAGVFDPGVAFAAHAAGAVRLALPPIRDPQPLSLAIVEALRGEDPHTGRSAAPRKGVLDDTVITNIRDAGYAVPRPTVVVWIAAAAGSPWLASVCAAVRDAVASERVEAWVLLALTNVYPRDTAAHAERAASCAAQPWDALLVGRDGEQPLATFAYLFESHDERGTFWEGGDDVPFAAAEAIFVLTASAITTTREYEETLRRSLPGMVHRPFERMSGIGTSRLTFPRAQAEQCCAALLGADVLRAWAKEEHGAASRELAEEQRSAAADTLAKLRRASRDADAYRRGGRSSPRLSAEGVAKVRGLARPDPDGGLIFAHLRRDRVDRLVTPTLDYPDALALAAERAEAGVEQWRPAVRARWQQFAYQTERGIIAHVNGLVLREAAGIAAARAYAAELDGLLAEEKRRLYAKQEERETSYRRFLRRAERIAEDGPWLGVDAPTPARPARIADGQTPAAAASPDTGVSLAPSVFMLAALAARYRWHKDRQPPVAATVGAALVGVPPAVFLALALLPAAWFAHGPTGALAVTLTLIVAAALAGWAFASYRARLVDNAVEDIRRVYRRALSHRCEREEFQQRLALLTGVQHTIRVVLDRLVAWDRFILEQADRLETEAARIEAALFDGATGRRDVLIANRQRLRPHGYTLRDFAADARTRRETAALDPDAGILDWHKRDAAILRRLRAELRGKVSVLDTESTDLGPPVGAFCLGVVRPYLRGDLVSIAAALESLRADDTPSLYDQLIERSVILYRPLDPPRPPGVFVAARAEHHLALRPADRPTDAVALATDEDEWLATLRLRPGGAVPSFFADTDQFEQRPGRLIVPSVPGWGLHA